jgi:small-conductance mechanosensitive channel
MKKIKDLQISDFSKPMDEKFFEQWKAQQSKLKVSINYFFAAMTIFIVLFIISYFLNKVILFYFLFWSGMIVLIWPIIIIIRLIKIKKTQKILKVSDEDIKSAREKV